MSQNCERPQIIKIDKIHTFFKADFKSDYVFKGESHEWWEMVFVLNGRVGVRADGSEYVLEQHQAIIHSPNEFHKIWTVSESVPTVIVISFSAATIPAPGGRIFNLGNSQTEELRNLYEISQRCFRYDNIEIFSVKDKCEIIAQEFWLRLELFVLRFFSQTETVEHTVFSKGTKSADLYAAVVSFMEHNPGAGYCVDDIASHFSVSGAYLKKIFEKYASCGVIQYYNRLRMRLACEYLSSGKSVKETSEFLGFGDQNYFSTFFKRLSGKSPTEFKKGQ